MKRMLINASHGVRVALVDGNSLFDLDIERTQKQTVNNIYKAVVNRVEPSLAAAFVDYGSGRDGFLPIKEVAREYFNKNHQHSPGERPNIRDALSPGQEIIIQVVKEERGTKGAALRTFISLAGRYLVLMPNNPRAGGISRQIEGEDREDLKTNLDQLNAPEGMGVIVRTAGFGRHIDELKWDLDYLLSQWAAIQEAANQRSGSFLIYQEGDVITRALRDNLRPDIEEIIIDNVQAYERAREHLKITRPEFYDKVKLYQDQDPLFTRYQIEHQIESAFKRVINLENRGSIVIDHTEALTSIDINSARATEGADIEETALNTNLVAAKEISRQLRLRDLGGLIVIDFIDMSNPRHQREVERVLKEELKKDRARVQMGKITRFGLLEMSRQRLQPSLGDANLVTCSRCDGQGTIRGVESLSMSLIRILEEESMKPQTGQVRAQLPVEVATFLMNEKRDVIIDLEKRHSVQIMIIGNTHLQTPHYKISRLKVEEMSRAAKTTSYELAKEIEPEEPQVEWTAPRSQTETPAVSHVAPSTLPPMPKSSSGESGLIRRLWSSVFGNTEKNTQQPAATASKTASLAEPENTTQSQDRKNAPHGRQGQGQQGRNRQRNRREPQQAAAGTGTATGTQTNSNRNRNDNRRPHNQERAAQQQDVSAAPTVAPAAAPEPRQERAPRPPRTDKVETTPRGQQPQTRRATNDEQNMHRRQNTRKKQEPRVDSANAPSQTEVAASPNQAPAPKQAQQPRSEAREKPVSKEAPKRVPILPPVEVTPESTQKNKRRNQIGFVRLSEEDAKKSIVQVESTQLDIQERQARLSKVVTKPSDKVVTPAPAPMSSMSAMKPKRKEVAPTKEAEQLKESD